MKQLAAITVVTLALLVSTPTPAAQAQTRAPSYLILRAPARKHKGHAYYPGRGFEVRTHAYAYGYFGVKPRKHLRRSTGYHEGYIQWTKQ